MVSDSDKVHWEPWVYEGRWRQSDTERIRSTESARFRTSLGHIRNVFGALLLVQQDCADFCLSQLRIPTPLGARVYC